MIALIAVIVVIGLVAIAVNELRDWRYWRRVNKAIDLVKSENPEFDADALRCQLERDRQRRFHDDEPPTSMAA